MAEGKGQTMAGLEEQLGPRAMWRRVRLCLDNTSFHMISWILQDTYLLTKLAITLLFTVGLLVSICAVSLSVSSWTLL